MRREFLYATSVLTSLTVLGGLSMQTAYAQQAAQGGLEEITVTARKVEENLMQVPLSIVAVTAASIESAGIKDARDIAPYTPGLFISYSIAFQASARNLFFRGDAVDAGLTFIDGAPYGGQANPDINSLERVEVLVGPQSAYFGRSTFTGAINFVTKDPGNTFKGKVSAEVSTFNSTNDSIMLEGPIVTDKFSVRLTGSHYVQGGQWANASDPSYKMGGVQKDSATAVLLFTPNDRLKAKAFLQGSLDNNGYEGTVMLSGWGSNPTAPNVPKVQSRQLFCNQGGSFGSWWCGALPSAKTLPSMDQPGTSSIISGYFAVTPKLYDALINNAYHLEPNLFDPHWLTNIGSKNLTLSGHLQVDYSFSDGWSLSSNTALHKTKYQALSQTGYRDEQLVPNPYAVPIAGLGGLGPTGATLASGSSVVSVPIAGYMGLPFMQYRGIFQSIVYDGSQELRITSPQDKPLRGSVGANYFNRYSPGQVNYSMQPSGVTGPGITSLAVSGNLSRSVNSTPAVFGGLYYDITSQLTATAEARYQWDGISSTTNFVFGAANTAPQPTLHAVFKSFSPRIGLDYKLTPEQMIYALYSVGYSPGGFNASIVGQTAAISAQLAALGTQLTFSQEKLINWEGGLKSTWLDGRMRTTIDGYFQKWENGQVTNNLLVTTSAGGVQMVGVTQNVGLTHLYGIEATFAAAVTDKLTVGANYNLVKSKIMQYVYFPNGARLTSACAPLNGATCTIGNSFPLNPVGSTFAINATYTDHLLGDWDWYARMDWKHRARYYIDFTNLAWIPPTDTVDARIGVKDANKTIELWVTNLTNQQEFSSGEVGTDVASASASNINAVRVILPPKRQFGIKGSYTF